MNGQKPAAFFIRTPEGIDFSMPLAGVVSRMLARTIDFIIVLGITTIITFFIRLIGFASVDLAQFLIILSYFIIAFGYGILLEWKWRGQTVGKKMLSIRVMDEQGLRLQFSQVIIRNLMRFVDALPLCYLVGGSTALISSRSQRLGDFTANTIVVRLRKGRTLNIEKSESEKYNSMRQHAHLAARLRQRTTPAEAALAMRALLRRDQIEAHERIILFKELADHLKTQVHFPEEVTFGLTDEQYVRNAVEILYGRTDMEDGIVKERAAQV